MHNSPIIFTDLDDTLFQTKRKFKPDDDFDHAIVGALDRQLQPRSFISPKQQSLLNWLSKTANVIPVTARGTEEIARVKIKFTSYQITTHGAVIQQQKQIDLKWKEHILTQLDLVTPELIKLEKHVSSMLNKQRRHQLLPDVDAWCRINYEYNQPIYLVMKVSNSKYITELNQLADWVENTFNLDKFYVHRNDNNIAWLPRCISKSSAVEYLIKKYKQENPHRSILGIGDSLSDYDFMNLCDFLVIPNQSQLNKKIQNI